MGRFVRNLIWVQAALVVLCSLWLVTVAAAQSVSLPLTLADVLERVERTHPKLRGAELQRRLATAKRIEKQGSFDPSLAIVNDTQRYNSNPIAGEAKFETLSDVSLGVLTRYGAKLSLNSEYHYGDIKSPASGTGTTGTHFLGLSIPFLRGAGINPKAAEERQAQLGEPLANAEYRQFRLALLLRASDTYWNWMAAKKRMDVNESLIELANTRAQLVEQRATAGDLPLIDAVEAKQEVQRRQESWVKAQREFQKSTFSLANYLWTDSTTSVITPGADQAPDSLPQPVELDSNAIDESKILALKQRPELAQISVLKTITDVDLDLARNQLLPILDVYAGPGLDTGTSNIGPTLKAGISLVVPLRNRTARGQIDQARLKLEKLGLDEQAMIQQVLLEVDDTISELNTVFQRFQAANESYLLALQLEEGERTRFDLGDSTLFLVNQRERATAESLIKVIEIQAEYQQALVRLLAVTGSL